MSAVQGAGEQRAGDADSLQLRQVAGMADAAGGEQPAVRCVALHTLQLCQIGSAVAADAVEAHADYAVRPECGAGRYIGLPERPAVAEVQRQNEFVPGAG